MFQHLLVQLLEQYVQEFLGNWDLASNLRIGGLTEPTINLTNVPLPQVIFDLAEIPFIVEYSNIAKVFGRCSWGTFFGRHNAHPLEIELEDAEIRLRFAYPSEWDAEKWKNKLLESKLKRAALWQRFVSVLSKETVDNSLSQTLECRLTNALKIRAKNIHVRLFDDNFSSVPFAFDFYVAEVNIDSPSADDPRLSGIEKEGIYQHLLSSLWIRFVGMHIFYKEFSAPVYPDRKDVWLKNKYGIAYLMRRKSTVRRSFFERVKGRHGSCSLSLKDSGQLLRQRLKELSKLREGKIKKTLYSADCSSDCSHGENQHATQDHHNPAAPSLHAASSFNLPMRKAEQQRPWCLPGDETVEPGMSQENSSVDLSRKDGNKEHNLRRSDSSKTSPAMCRRRTLPSATGRFTGKRDDAAAPHRPNAAFGSRDSRDSFLTRLFTRSQNSALPEKKRVPSVNKSGFRSASQQRPEGDTPIFSCPEELLFKQDLLHGSCKNVATPHDVSSFSLGKSEKRPTFFQKPQSVGSVPPHVDIVRAHKRNPPFEKDVSTPSPTSRKAAARFTQEPLHTAFNSNAQSETSSEKSSSVKNDVKQTYARHTKRGATKRLSLENTKSGSLQLLYALKRRRSKARRLTKSTPLAPETGNSSRSVPKAFVAASFSDDHMDSSAFVPPDSSCSKKSSKTSVSNKQQSQASVYKTQQSVLSGELRGKTGRRGARHYSFHEYGEPLSGAKGGSSPRKVSSVAANDLTRLFGVRGKNGVADPNDRGFRITSFNGIEMHILMKKWSIRALQRLDLTKESLKYVQLSFIPHSPPPPSPEKRRTSRETKHEGASQSPTAHQKQGLCSPLGVPAPVFNGSCNYGPLAVTFTEAAFEAFFNFVKFLDLWFVFLRGVAQPTRCIPTRALRQRYMELWKLRTASNALLPEELAEIETLETMLPLYAILSARETVEASIWSNLGIAGFARHITGRVQGVCHRVFSGFASSRTPQHANSIDSRGSCAGCRSCFCGRGSLDGSQREEEDNNPSDAQSDGNGSKGMLDCISQENNFHWFQRHSFLEVVLPNLRCEIIPYVAPGSQVQGGPLKLLTRDADDGLTSHSKAMINPAPPNSIARLGTGEGIVFCCALRYIAEKTNDHNKRAHIILDNITVVQRPIEVFLYHTPTAMRREYPHNPDCQTPVPLYLIASSPVPRQPVHLTLCSIQDYPQVSGYLQRLSENPDVDITTDPLLHFDDHLCWTVESSGLFGRNEPIAAEDVSPGRKIFKDFKNLRSGFSRAPATTADNTKLYCRKPLVHPPTRLTVVIEEHTAANLKKTLVVIPHCVVDASRLLLLATCFPPKFHVHRDLFNCVDAPIPFNVLDAQNLGYFSAPSLRPLEINISNIYLIVNSERRCSATAQEKVYSHTQSTVGNCKECCGRKFPLPADAGVLTTTQSWKDRPLASASVKKIRRMREKKLMCSSAKVLPPHKSSSTIALLCLVVNDFSLLMGENHFICVTIRSASVHALNLDTTQTGECRRPMGQFSNAKTNDNNTSPSLILFPVAVTVSPDYNATDSVLPSHLNTQAPLPHIPAFDAETLLICATNFCLLRRSASKQVTTNMFSRQRLRRYSRANSLESSAASRHSDVETSDPLLPSSSHLEIGVENVSFGICDALVAVFCSWEDYAFRNVDFHNILYRLRMFTSARWLDPTSHVAPILKKFIWIPTLQIADLGSFEPSFPTLLYRDSVTSETQACHLYLQHRVPLVLGHPVLTAEDKASGIMLNIRQDSKAQAFESNVPSPNNTANALAIMQANSVTSQLHIDVGLGKLDFLVYNGPVAEFGIQLFCCHLALEKIKRHNQQQAEISTKFSLQEVHITELRPTSETQFDSTIVMCRNVAHVACRTRCKAEAQFTTEPGQKTQSALAQQSPRTYSRRLANATLRKTECSPNSRDTSIGTSRSGSGDYKSSDVTSTMQMTENTYQPVVITDLKHQTACIDCQPSAPLPAFYTSDHHNNYHHCHPPQQNDDKISAPQPELKLDHLNVCVTPHCRVSPEPFTQNGQQFFVPWTSWTQSTTAALTSGNGASSPSQSPHCLLPNGATTAVPVGTAWCCESLRTGSPTHKRNDCDNLIRGIRKNPASAVLEQFGNPTDFQIIATLTTSDSVCHAALELRSFYIFVGPATVTRSVAVVRNLLKDAELERKRRKTSHLASQSVEQASSTDAEQLETQPSWSTVRSSPWEKPPLNGKKRSIYSRQNGNLSQFSAQPQKHFVNAKDMEPTKTVFPPNCSSTPCGFSEDKHEKETLLPIRYSLAITLDCININPVYCSALTHARFSDLYKRDEPNRHDGTDVEAFSTAERLPRQGTSCNTPLSNHLHTYSTPLFIGADPTLESYPWKKKSIECNALDRPLTKRGFLLEASLSASDAQTFAENNRDGPPDSMSDRLEESRSKGVGDRIQFGWPAVASVQQLAAKTALETPYDMRAAVLDVDFIGIRLTTHLDISLTVFSSEFTNTPGHALAQTNAFLFPSHGDEHPQPKLGRATDSINTPRFPFSDFSSYYYRVSVKAQGLELDMLRNGTWMITSLVVPTVDTQIAFYFPSNASSPAFGTLVAQESCSPVSAHEPHYQLRNCQARTTKCIAPTGKRENSTTAALYDTFARPSSSHLAKRRHPNARRRARKNGQTIGLTSTGSSPACYIDYLGLEIQQLVFWSASYWQHSKLCSHHELLDADSCYVQPRKPKKASKTTYQETVRNCSNMDVYPRPLSFSLVWGGTPYPASTCVEPSRCNALKKNIPHGSLGEDRVLRTPDPQNSQHIDTAEVSQAPRKNIFCTVGLQQQYLLEQPWYSPRIAALLPSRPPFTECVSRCQTCLLPVLYLNQKLATSEPTTLDAAKPPTQLSFSYSRKQFTQTASPCHFISLKVAPTNCVIEPHTYKNLQQALEYFQFWKTVVTSEMSNTLSRDPEIRPVQKLESPASTPHRVHDSEDERLKAQAAGNVFPSPHVLLRLVIPAFKGLESGFRSKIAGNVYTDVQFEHLQVMSCSVDTLVQAPKITAELVLNKRQMRFSSPTQKYSTLLFQLPRCYTLMCIAKEPAPVVTFNTCFTAQVVGTDSQDLFTVNYLPFAFATHFKNACGKRNGADLGGLVSSSIITPPLLSLMSIHPKRRLTEFASTTSLQSLNEQFFGITFHIPLLSVGLIMNTDLSAAQTAHAVERNWERRSACDAGCCFIDDVAKKHQKKLSLLALSMKKTIHGLQLPIFRCDIALFKTKNPGTAVTASMCIGEVSLRDFHDRSFFQSTSLLKRYFGISRTPSNTNSTMLQQQILPKLHLANNSNEEYQVTCSLHFSPSKVSTGLQLRSSRLEIDVASLQLIPDCIRAILRTLKDLRVLQIVYPELNFRSAPYLSSAKAFQGEPRVGFGRLCVGNVPLEYAPLSVVDEALCTQQLPENYGCGIPPPNTHLSCVYPSRLPAFLKRSNLLKLRKTYLPFLGGGTFTPNFLMEMSEAKRWTPSASVPELFPLIHYKTTTTPSSLGNSSSSDDVESNDDVPEDITLDIPDERWKLEHDSVFCRLIENTHCAGNQRHSDDQTILSPYKPTPQDVSASRLLWANSGFVDHVANWETPEKSEKKQNWPPDPSKIHHNLSDVDKRQTFMDRLRNISTVQKDFSSMDSVTEEGDIRKPLSCSEKVLENGSSTRKPKNGSPTVHLQEDSFTTQTDIPFSVPSNRRGIKALRNRVRALLKLRHSADRDGATYSVKRPATGFGPRDSQNIAERNTRTAAQTVGKEHGFLLGETPCGPDADAKSGNASERNVAAANGNALELEVACTVSVDALEVWIWPLDEIEPSVLGSPTGEMQSRRSRHPPIDLAGQEPDIVINSSCHRAMDQDDEDEITDATSLASTATRHSRANSTVALDEHFALSSITKKVVPTKLLARQRLQALQNNVNIGFLGEEYPRTTEHQGKRPVIGILLSVIGEISIEQDKFSGGVQLVECNVMLGYPEGPTSLQFTSAPNPKHSFQNRTADDCKNFISVRVFDEDGTKQSMYRRLQDEKIPRGTPDLLSNRNSARPGRTATHHDCSLSSHLEPAPSPNADTADWGHSANGFDNANIKLSSVFSFRGLTIRREHLHRFPPILVGLSGGLLRSGMVARDKDDCLFTLGNAQIAVHRITRLYKDTTTFSNNAVPQQNCFIRIRVENPNLQFSLDTLWSLNHLPILTQYFITHHVKRWRDDPPSVSFFLLELASYQFVAEQLIAAQALAATRQAGRKKPAKTLGIFQRNALTKPEIKTDADGRVSFTDWTAQRVNITTTSSRCYSREHLTESYSNQGDYEPMMLSEIASHSLSSSDDNTRFSSDDDIASSEQPYEPSYGSDYLYPGIDVTAAATHDLVPVPLPLDPQTALSFCELLSSKMWKSEKAGGVYGVTGDLDDTVLGTTLDSPTLSSRIDARQALTNNPTSTAQMSETQRKKNRVQSAADALQEQAFYDETLDRQILRFFFKMCSVEEGQTVIQLDLQVDSANVNLHDPYVQLLELRITQISVEATVPLVNSSSVICNVTFSLSAYNPLTSAMERLLDSICIRLGVVRRLAGFKTRDLCPWLDISLRIDPLKLDISSGLLQILRRLYDLIYREWRGTTQLGKMKTVTIHNDTNAPMILLQRWKGTTGCGAPPHLQKRWYDAFLKEGQSCAASVESPIWFATRKSSDAQHNGDDEQGVKGSPDNVVPSIWRRQRWRRWFRRVNSSDKPRSGSLSTNSFFNLETDNDVRELTKQILTLGSSAPLFSYFQAYQRALLFGRTRTVEILLQLLADMLPSTSAASDSSSLMLGVAHIFRLFRTQRGWCSIGRLHPDYQTQRAYYMPDGGFHVVVEPVSSCSSTTHSWMLCVGTSIQIANISNTPFKIFTSRRYGAMRRIAQRLHGDPGEASAGASGAAGGAWCSSATIVVAPQSRVSVPLSWFFSGRVPFIVPVLGDENMHSFFASFGEQFSNSPSTFAAHQDTHTAPLHGLGRRRSSSGFSQPRHNAHSTHLRRSHYWNTRKRKNSNGLVAVDINQEDTLRDLVLPQPFTVLQRLLESVSHANVMNLKHRRVEKCTLTFRKQVAWDVVVDTTEIPTNMPNRTATKYTIKLVPYITLQNVLPFPMTVFLRPNRVLSKALQRKTSGRHYRNRSSLQRQQHSSADDAVHLLLGYELKAYIPPHYSWQIPCSSQNITIRIAVHGCPIETFCNSVHTAEANKTFARQQGKIQTAMDASYYALRHSDPPYTTDFQDTLVPKHTPTYVSQSTSLWLPTSDTTTTRLQLMHRGRLALEDVPSLQGLIPLCSRLLKSDKSRPITSTYPSFTIIADVSRQLITLFAPYFVENACHDLALFFNAKLIPPRCRLYVSEEDAKGVRLRVLREVPSVPPEAASRLEISQVSTRIDVVATTNTRPPIYLRFSSMRKTARRVMAGNQEQKRDFWASWCKNVIGRFLHRCWLSLTNCCRRPSILETDDPAEGWMPDPSSPTANYPTPAKVTPTNRTGWHEEKEKKAELLRKKRRKAQSVLRFSAIKRSASFPAQDFMAQNGSDQWSLTHDDPSYFNAQEAHMEPSDRRRYFDDPAGTYHTSGQRTKSKDRTQKVTIAPDPKRGTFLRTKNVLQRRSKYGKPLTSAQLKLQKRGEKKQKSNEKRLVELKNAVQQLVTGVRDRVRHIASVRRATSFPPDQEKSFSDDNSLNNSFANTAVIDGIERTTSDLTNLRTFSRRHMRQEPQVNASLCFSEPSLSDTSSHASSKQEMSFVDGAAQPDVAYSIPNLAPINYATESLQRSVVLENLSVSKKPLVGHRGSYKGHLSPYGWYEPPQTTPEGSRRSSGVASPRGTHRARLSTVRSQQAAEKPMLSQDFLHFETGKVRLSVIDDTNSVVEHNSNARQTTDGAERSQAPEPKKLRTSRLELPHKNKSFLSGSRASLASRSEAPWSTLSGAVTKKRHSAGLLQNDQMQYHGARRLQPPQAVSPVLLARSDNDASRLNDADIMVHDNAKSRAEQWLKPSEFKCFSVFPEIEGMGYHGGGSTASASVISLGVSVRYALAPYDLSKIITFLPRYLIFSQLPFLALVKDAKASSLLPVGTRMYQKNVLILPPGECLPFHTRESRCFLEVPMQSGTFTCAPFSLVPSHIPCTFQVEMISSNASSLSADVKSLRQIIQVNVVSGSFSELFGASPLPFTYNGLFLVLSIPKYPQFRIRNLTRYRLQLAAVGDKVPEFNEEHDLLPPKMLQKRAAQDNVPLSDGVGVPRAASKMKFPQHSIHPGNDSRRYIFRDSSRAQANPKCSLREVGPGLEVPYVPSEKGNKIGVKLLVAGTKRANWVTVSLTTVNTAPTVIPFTDYTSRKASFSTEAVNASTVPTGPTTTQETNHVDSSGNEILFPNKDVSMPWTHASEEVLGGGPKSGKDNNDKPNRRLYAFLTVDSRGSRVLTVTESRKLVARLRAGQVIRFSTPHPHEPVQSAKAFRAKTNKILRRVPEVAKNRFPGAPRFSNVDIITKKKEGLRQRQLPPAMMQLPWLGVNIEFLLPKITVTWTSQSDVILALHLSTVKLEAFAAPTRFSRRWQGLWNLRNLLKKGSKNVSFDFLVPAPTSKPKRAGANRDSGPSLYSPNPPPFLWEQPLPLEPGSRTALGSPRYRAVVARLPPDTSQLNAQGIRHPNTNDKKQTVIKNDINNAELDAEKRERNRRFSDFETQTFANSQIRMELTLGGIHCDHYVEGDIPVILKSTTNPTTVGNKSDATPFFLLKMVKRVVDPTFAPIFDDVTITLSPLAANVEFSVVEQLISLGEKELFLMQSTVPCVAGMDVMPLASPKNATERDNISETLHQDSMSPKQGKHVCCLRTNDTHLFFMRNATQQGLSYDGYLNKWIQVHLPLNRTAVPKNLNGNGAALKLQHFQGVPTIDVVSKTRLLLPDARSVDNLSLERQCAELNRDVYFQEHSAHHSVDSRGVCAENNAHHVLQPYRLPSGIEIALLDSPRESTDYFSGFSLKAITYVLSLKSIAKFVERRAAENFAMYNYCVSTTYDKCFPSYLAQKHQASENCSNNPAFIDFKFCDGNEAEKLFKPTSDLLASYYRSLNVLGEQLAGSVELSHRPGKNSQTVGESQRVYNRQTKVFYYSSSVFSHWFMFPSPRWVELKEARPVYMKSLRINAFFMVISIRTSNKRISRQVLHIVDALPLDTPYMGVQIGSEKRLYTVCAWGELFHSLRNSYLKQLIRQTLPSAWLFNPLAFATGTWRGGKALVQATKQGALQTSTSQRRRFNLEGGILGFRLGFVMLMLYATGGIFQTCSHFGNLLHKAMGGSRPRPQGVLDAIWKGIYGLFEDTLVTPWIALYASPATSISRGDGLCKLLIIFFGCLLRCLVCPLFGFLNFVTSVTEGFANALIGDFEQFARMQEQSEFLAKTAGRRKYTAGGSTSGSRDDGILDRAASTGLPLFETRLRDRRTAMSSEHGSSLATATAKITATPAPNNRELSAEPTPATTAVKSRM